jgi:transglutaminase-like putative cysteine protease
MNKKSLKYLHIFFSLLVFFFITGASLENRKNSGPNSQFLNSRDVKLKIDYKFSIKGHSDTLKVKMIIPGTLINRQTVNKISFSVQPDSIYLLNSNKYALFTFTNVDKNFKISIKCNLTIFSTINEKNDSSETGLSRYLVAEKNIESESPKIIETAATLKQKTDIETVIKTFEYVTTTIRYEANAAIGAEKVLETKVGKCMDYSDLFVALLRANKIPAKSIFGMVVDYDGDNPLHAWPEAYLKKQGWVRFDPTTGHSEITQSGKNYIMQISNKYIVLSEGRNDMELHANILEYLYKSGDTCNIKVNTSFDIDGQDNQNEF